jgi:chromosome segregation ATPase
VSVLVGKIEVWTHKMLICSVSRLEASRLEAQLESSSSAVSAKLQAAQAEKVTLQADLAKKAGRAQELEAQLEALASELRDLRESGMAAEIRMREVGAAKESLQREVSSHSARAQAIEADLEHSRSRIVDLEAEVTELRASSATATAAQGELEKRVKSLDADKAAAGTRLKDLEAQLRVAQAEDRVGAAKALIASALEEKEALAARVTELETVVSERRAEEQALRDAGAKQLKAAEDQKAAVEKARHALSSRVTELEGAVRERDARVAGMVNEIETVKALLARSEAQREHLGTQVKGLEVALAEAAARSVALEHEVKELGRAKADLEQSQVESPAGDGAEIAKTLRRLELEVEEWKKSAKRRDEENNRLQEERDALLRDMDILREASQTEGATPQLEVPYSSVVARTTHGFIDQHT